MKTCSSTSTNSQKDYGSTKPGKALTLAINEMCSAWLVAKESGWDPMSYCDLDWIVPYKRR